MPEAKILEISSDQQAWMLQELRRCRYGYFLALHILLLYALVLGVGVIGLPLGFIPHVFFPDQAAQLEVPLTTPGRRQHVVQHPPRPGGRGEEAHEDFEQGGLAGPVRPEQADAAGGEAQGDAAEGGDGPEGAAQVIEFDQVVHVGLL